jgi:hypothetical protein
MEPFGKPAPFKVGRLQAYCPGCGGAEFVRSRRFGLERADALTCSGCGAEHMRSTLMQQITEKVIDDAQRALHRAELGRADPGSAENEALHGKLKEAAELLQFPAVKGHVERASSLLLAIARKAPSIAVRDAAMKAITLAGAAKSASPLSNDRANLDRLLAQIRRGLQRK